MYENKTDWQVSLSGKTKKQSGKLPDNIAFQFFTLVKELRANGPDLINWPNYGKIKGQGKNVDMRHCRLNKGRAVYVAVWVADGINKKIEVRYVGTHENADYRRIS
jgi:hypothetical protein